MLQNKEDLKNKIIYRASYRGTKEMDILMIAFVKSLINTLDIDELIELEKFVNLDDQVLLNLNKYFNKNENPIVNKIYKEFYNFKPI